MIKNGGDYLFVYGTLRRAFGHELSSLLAKQAVLVGEGFFQGRLFRVADYPGAVPSSAPADQIRGEVYRLKDPDRTLAALDEYEEVAQGAPDQGLYRRELVEVTLRGGRAIKAWIYLYNQSTRGLPEIHSGDYLEAADVSGRER